MESGWRDSGGFATWIFCEDEAAEAIPVSSAPFVVFLPASLGRIFYERLPKRTAVSFFHCHTFRNIQPQVAVLIPHHVSENRRRIDSQLLQLSAQRLDLTLLLRNQQPEVLNTLVMGRARYAETTGRVICIMRPLKIMQLNNSQIMPFSYFDCQSCPHRKLFETCLKHVPREGLT